MKDENGKVLRRDFEKRRRIMVLMNKGLRNCEIMEHGFKESLILVMRKEYKAGRATAAAVTAARKGRP